MDRKAFLKTCAGGLCAFAGGAACAEEPKPDDWRLPFVRKRHAHFMNLLSDTLEPGRLQDLLRRQGAYCSALSDKTLDRSIEDGTPGVVCDCALGWQQHTWERIFGRKVRLEPVETVLRGGARCTFRIHVLDEPV